MWIIKILLVISAIAARADVHELIKKDGYSYDRPESIPAELAFYLNVPAGHDPSAYISTNTQHHQFSGGNLSPSVGQNHFHQHQQHQQFNNIVPSLETHGHSLNTNQHHFNEPSSQYIPPAPSSEFILPFIKENSGFRPQHQFSSQQHHQQHSFPASQQQQFQYQVEPRSLHQSPSQNTFRFPQAQNSPYPSQELQPPPTIHTPSPSAILKNQPESNHRFMASISNSYNAPLPFPFGVVPLKFEPLPLKTHLRQEKLLPITSYEAKVFYKKK